MAPIDSDWVNYLLLCLSYLKHSAEILEFKTLNAKSWLDLCIDIINIVMTKVLSCFFSQYCNIIFKFDLQSKFNIFLVFFALNKHCHSVLLITEVYVKVFHKIIVILYVVNFWNVCFLQLNEDQSFKVVYNLFVVRIRFLCFRNAVFFKHILLNCIFHKVVCNFVGYTTIHFTLLVLVKVICENPFWTFSYQGQTTGAVNCD